MRDNEFEAYAKRDFKFLIAEKGYRCTLSTPDHVRFESSKVFIDLTYDGKRSFELGLHVGEIGSRTSYSIAEILRFRNAPEAQKLSLVQVTSDAVMDSFSKQIAVALRRYADDLVAGNKLIFAEVAAQRKREVEAYALERDLRSARSASDRAWQSKDYRSVVKALEPMREFLTPSEIEKLNLAERKLGSKDAT